jgi:hypothetical protein
MSARSFIITIIIVDRRFLNVVWGWIRDFSRSVRVEERNRKERRGEGREDGAGAQQMYKGLGASVTSSI